MKLGKNEIMAIVESALFLVGAIFMAIVFIVPSNPLWAFILGLILALIAIGLWVTPPIANLIKKTITEKRETTLTATSVAEATATDETYELHRPLNNEQPTAAEQPTDQPADSADATPTDKPKVDLDF